MLVNVCAVGEAGEDASALRPEGATEAAPAAPAAPEAPATPAAPAAPAAAAPAVAPVAAKSDDIVRISPRARALAQRAGVDAARATGTGAHGRIVEADVRRLMKEGPAEAPVAAPEIGEYEDVKFSGIRRAISKSMKESLSGGAQLTNNHSFDATSIQRIRAEFKAAGGELGGVTIGDMVLFAVSRTLKNHPDLNAIMLDDTTIRRYTGVNLAVAVDTPRGLMVPVIFGADKKSLVEISKELKQLAADARSGSINPDLLRGGSFTVSNLGAFGVESFTPVINPPQTGILGVCNITPKARQTANGGYEFYPAMGLSLTYDHRAVDGAPAAKFLKDLGTALENFDLLLAK